jgi:hypothetical protein
MWPVVLGALHPCSLPEPGISLSGRNIVLRGIKRSWQRGRLDLNLSK